MSRLASLTVVAVLLASFGIAAARGEAKPAAAVSGAPAPASAAIPPSSAAAKVSAPAPSSAAAFGNQTPAATGSATSSATAAGGSPAGQDTSALFACGGSSARPSIKRSAARLPPPTPAQIQSYQALEKEFADYQGEAKDYRSTLTTIVRHHYDEKRRRVLGGLDREIAIEQRALSDARNDAIKRLETFVARYSGSNADPEATPDAMYRLAALYEEKARVNFESDLAKNLKPAIGLYRRIIREYPNYSEIAGVYYFLGHAYTDSTRLDEGQQAWRALVCSNQYSVNDDPKDSDKIVVQGLAQDHDEKFWNDWYNRHPVPLDHGEPIGAKGKRKEKEKVTKKGGAKPAPQTALLEDDELRFKDPYPESCEPVHQKVPPDEEPKYLAEVWWQIGNFHFDQLATSGGPYELNRAVRSYEHSMKYKKPPLYGVAMYKRAWSYFKQQRYKIAIRTFVDLLRYADEQQAKTGDPGADFRQEAYTYIAGSLTYVDLEGPPEDHPNIPRNDVLDVETNPVVAEDKMRVAIDRVQDPALIPQDQKWTVEIYKALAEEFMEISQNRNAIALMDLTLKKFPMDREAPKMQSKVAELYDQLARLAPESSAVRLEYNAKALEARTKLAAFVGATPWTAANHDDPEALQAAEDLVRNGLQRAAADHTNYARNFFHRARELNDAGEQRALLDKAVAEYRLAETGWAAYIEQEPTATDAYESRFWLADARYWIVVLQVTLERSPTADEIRRAAAAAMDVRDSNEDDKYLQQSGYYLVSIAEKILEDKYRQYRASGGAQGLEKRDALTFSGEGTARKVVSFPVPPEVLQAICVRDEYNARIPADKDPEKNGLLYAYQAADYYFVYGHFDEAKQRFQPIYDQYCGQNEWGYKAWEKLISMSNFQGDAAQSRALAEGKTCAFNEDTRAAEEAIRKPVRQGVAYLDAQKLYEQAEKMPDGPERQKKWREAAAAYKVALDAAPDRDEAPEAAMNGAFAYKQVGDYDKAIAMYELFISSYGSETKLDRLEHGDPSAKPPAPADPKKYEERVKFLKMAYDALANARVLFFDYPKAAETFDSISRNKHFAQADQRGAARQALSLYSSLGDTAGMQRARERFLALGASPKERAEADYIVASADLKKWDEYSPDTGANEAARQRAESSMKAYFDLNRNNDAAGQYVVNAAYNVAKAKRAAKSPEADQWWDTTMRAFEKYRVVAPRNPDGSSTAVGSPEASMAAEGAFTLVDRDVRKDFDYETGHHHYHGTAVEVINSYRADAVDAKKWYDKLQRVVDDYAAPEWAAAAIARQGSLYDSLRTGLYETRPPALVMFDKKTERLLKMAETSNNARLQEQADAARTNVQNAWRDKKEQELNSADQIMVDRYGNALMLARRYNVSNPAVVRAIQRLAFFTDVIGEAKLATYATRVKDLNYTPGTFLRIRPGLVTAPESSGMPPPQPDPSPAQMSVSALEPYRAGYQAFAAGNIAAAKTQFARAVAADAKAAPAEHALGAVEERIGSTSAALSAYRAALGAQKDYDPAISAYALLLARTASANDAESFLNGQRAALPTSAGVLAALGEVKSIEKDSASAQQLSQEALKRNPDYRPAMVTLARDHYRNRRLDLALYALTAILDGYGPENPPRDKNNGEALLLRGLIYKEEGRRRDAFSDFKRAVSLRPDLVEAKINLGKYMLEAGNANDAVPLLESVLGYDPSNLFVHLDLGDAYRLQGRPGEAIKHFQWVIAKDPTIAEAHYNMGLMYLFSTGIPSVTPQGAVDKAIDELEKFKSMRPRTRAGVGDDADELLSRAKNKKAILAAEAAAPAAQPTTTPQAAPAAPAGSQPAPTPTAPSGTAPAAPAPTAPASQGSFPAR